MHTRYLSKDVSCAPLPSLTVSSSSPRTTFPLTRFCRKTTLTKHVLRNHPEWAHDPDAVSTAVFEEVDREDWDGFAAAREGDEEGDYGVPHGQERDDMQLPTPPTGYGFDGAPTTPEPASGNRRKQQRGSTGRRSGRNAHGSAARRGGGGDPDYGADGDGSGSNQGKAYVTPPPSQHEVRRSKRRATRRRYADEVSEDDAGGQMDDEDDDEYREGAHEQHHHQHPRRVSVGQGRRQLVYPSSAPYPPMHARRTPRMVFIPPPNSPRAAPSPVAYQRRQLSASPRYEHGQDSPPHHHQQQQQQQYQQQSPDLRLSSPMRGQLLTPSPQPPYAQLQRSVSHDGAMFHYAYSPSASPRPPAAATAELHAAAAPPVSLSYPMSVPMDHPTHSAPIPQSYQFSPLMSSPLRESQPIRYHRRASSAGLLDSMSDMSAFASPCLDQHALPAEGNGTAVVVGAGASSSTAHHGHDDEGSMYGLGLQLEPAVNIETTHERRLSEIHRIASPVRASFGLYDFDLNGGQPSPTSAFFSLGGNGSSSQLHRRESANFPSFPTFPGGGGGGLSSTLVAPGTTTNGGRKPSFGTITNQLLESMEAERSEDHLEFVHEEEDEDGDEPEQTPGDKPEPEPEPASEDKQEKDEAKKKEHAAKKEEAEKAAEAAEKEQEKKEEQIKLPKDVVEMETDA